MFGFVYLWYDRKRKKFCIGSHKGSLEDGYITRTGYMQRAYKKRPEDFKRRILQVCYIEDKKFLLEMEQRWLDLIDEKELGKKYYNLKKFASGGNCIAAFDEKRLNEYSNKLKNSAKKNGVHHRSRPVIVDGVRYDSVTDANKFVGYDLRKKLASKSLKNIGIYYEKDGPISIEEAIKFDEAQTLAIIANAREMAKSNIGRDYTEQTKKTVKTKRLKYGSNYHNNLPNARKVIVSGKEYPSISNCAKILGVDPKTVIHRIKSKNFSDYEWSLND